jgi:hypothetical protein
LKKASEYDGLCDNLRCRIGKEFELSFHIFFEFDALATVSYFFLGSGKTDPEDIRKTYPRSIRVLACSEAVGCG